MPNCFDPPNCKRSIYELKRPLPYSYAHSFACTNFLYLPLSIQMSNRPYRSDFIINPEWVSEEKSRAKVLQQALENQKAREARKQQEQGPMFDISKSYQY